MPLSKETLKYIANLAHLNINDHGTEQLEQEINSIMNFIEELRAVDTKTVPALFHPLALHQRLREDVVTENDCLSELEALAPLFDDGLYLVPKVIESESNK